MLIVRAPFLLKTGALEVKQKLLPVYSRLILSDFLALQGPRSLGNCGKHSADGETISPERKIKGPKKIFQFQTVGFLEGAVQQVFGNVKSDEIVICVRRVVAAGHLQNIETKLSLEM